MLRYGFLLASLCLTSYSMADAAKYKTVIDGYSARKVDEVIQGEVSTPEQLVVNLRGVDCFTLVDNVLALTKSNSRQAFLRQLVKTCYIDGNVSYLTRRHFLSDWFATSPQNARDVTPEISIHS